MTGKTPDKSNRLIRGLVAFVFLGLLFSFAQAQTGAIRGSAYPSISVADGRSSVTITAEVRTQNGSLAPDGTRVIFSTTSGSFRENVVSTSNGVARGTLVAGSIAGTAKITISAISLNASTTLDFEFVTDRAVLQTAKEFVEVTSPGIIRYSTELRMLAAEAPGMKVVLRYRDMVFEATDMQLVVPTTEVRARNVRMIWGPINQVFKELSFKLNRRSGFGTTTYFRNEPKFTPSGNFVRIDATREVFGLVNVSAAGIKQRTEPTDVNAFNFEDLNDLVTIIEAKKVIAYPMRDIQFIKANLTVSGISVMKLPLFQLSSQVTSPIITDQFLNVSGNQLAIDYPHYLTLKPGETSLLRFRTGTRAGHGIGSTGGTFLDYEMRWTRGDEMDGGLTVGGLGRKDWGINLRQSLRLGDRTSVSATLDFPQNRSLFGSANLSQSLPGAQLSLNANAGRNFRGSPFSNEQYFAIVEKDPIKMGSLPVKMYLGLTSTYQEFKTANLNRVQSSAGIRSRFQMTPLQLDRKSSLNASLALSSLAGRNVQRGLTSNANVSYYTSPIPNSSLSLSYDFFDDGLTSQLVGRHRLSMEAGWTARGFNMALFGSKSLDTDRINVYADLSARLTKDWRLGWQYGLDRFAGSSYSDMTVLLSYRIGFREVGLSFSSRTKRIGIELFGTRLDY